VFRLKGGGWYETDFKSDQDAKRNLADRPDADAPKDAPVEASKESDGKNKEAAAGADAAASTDKSADKPADKPAEKSEKAPAENAKKPIEPKASTRGGAPPRGRSGARRASKKSAPKLKRRR
jgi:hypothetical protein